MAGLEAFKKAVHKNHDGLFGWITNQSIKAD
jgi:hypothetical protein